VGGVEEGGLGNVGWEGGGEARDQWGEVGVGRWGLGEGSCSGWVSRVLWEYLRGMIRMAIGAISPTRG